MATSLARASSQSLEKTTAALPGALRIDDPAMLLPDRLASAEISPLCAVAECDAPSRACIPQIVLNGLPQVTDVDRRRGTGKA